MQLYPLSYYDDQANGYTLIKTVPLSSAMGAEIQGVHLPTMSDAQFAQVKSALYRYKMVYFRDQNLTIADQEKLTLRFECKACEMHVVGKMKPSVRQQARTNHD